MNYIIKKDNRYDYEGKHAHTIFTYKDGTRKIEKVKGYISSEENDKSAYEMNKLIYGKRMARKIRDVK